MKLFARSSGILAAAASVLLLWSGAAASAAVPASPWPMGDQDAARSGLNTAETTLSSTSIHGLHLQHTVTLAKSSSGGCGGSSPAFPAEVGNVLYLVNGGANSVSAYNVTTGARIWNHALDPAGSSIYVGLAVVGGRVLVGGVDCESQSDPNGFVRAFNATTGSQQWNVGTLGAAADIAVSNGKVVTTGSTVGSGATINVLDPATGKKVWNKTYDSSCTGFFTTTVVSRGNVIFCSEDFNGKGTLHALSLANGAQAWSKAGIYSNLRGDTDATSAVDLYADNPSGHVVDLAPATGAVKWTSTSETGAPLAVGKKRLYISCDGTAMCALPKAGGARLWKANVAPTHVAVASDLVYPAPGGPLLAGSGAHVAVTGYPTTATSVIIANGRLISSGAGRTVSIFGLS